MIDKTNKLKIDSDDLGSMILQKLNQSDQNRFEEIKHLITGFIIAFVIFIITITIGIVFYINTTSAMRETYINNVNSVILNQTEIRTLTDWENIPSEQRKSKLREHFNSIIQYYTNTSLPTEKMTLEQTIDVFNELWQTTSKMSINLFLPVAYMKVATNFNPNYDVNAKKGIAALLLKSIDNTINIPWVRNDPIFTTMYRGSDTAFNPAESARILVAKIVDLMVLFRNREDWVMFALFTNEYDVISKYWNDGKGAIPDEIYKSGPTAEALMYYYTFKNFKIPLIN